MPSSVLVIMLVVGIAGVVLLTLGWSNPDARRRHALQELAKLLAAPLETLEGNDNSFRIPFKYQGRDCTYEDIEEKGFQGQVFRRGILRMSTGVNVTIGFSEKDAGSVKDNVGSFSDISNPWAQNVGKLTVPRELERFNVFTNNITLTNMLLGDDAVLKIFERFKNIDSRGHPVMSLEVFDGVVALKFHASGGLRPSLVNFHGNITSIEDYLTKVSAVCAKIDAAQRNLKAMNL